MLTNEEFRVARVTRKFVVLALASLSVFLGTMTAAVQLTHAASVSPGNNQEKTDNSGNDRTARFPQFVFAEHVTLRDGKIVTFMDALAELDRLHHAKTPGLFVSWTEGMRGGATETKNSKDLFDFLVIHQMPAAGLGKDGHRYDLIRTAADLGFAAGTGVAGKVQGTDGKPLSGVTLALVPLNPPYGPGLIQRKKVSISNGRLMQPARYETARSNVKGEFVLHPSAVMHPTVLNWAVVAIHETGIAWLEDESLTDGKPLRLRKWSRLSGKVGANGADTVRLELQHSSDLRSIGFRIPVALQADSRFSATHVPPGKVVPWRYPKNNPQIVADAPVTLKPGRGRVLFLNKAAARKKVASPSMRAQPELGDMDAVEFKAYAPKQLERSRMSWAPVLIEIAEPDDPVCKDLRDRFVNREVIAHALKKGRFDVFTVAPESEIGHDLIAELAGEDEEPPRFAIYPKDRFAKATVLRAPITAHRFLDAITKAAASPREKVLPLIVAKHALIYQDRLIKWSQFENTIRRVARTSNARPALYVTRGGTEKAARLQQGLAKLKREINFHNFTVGSLGSRASSRWDAVRSPDDLRPDGQTLIGRVVAPDKEEIDGVAEIVLLRKDQEATLRFNGTHVANPLEEELYRSDQTGRFQLPVPDEDRRFVVTHAAGFVVLDRSQLLRDQGLIQLKPWGTLTGTLAPWHGYQVLDITSTLPGTRIRIQKTESIKYGENIYRVSPGELTVQRSLRISGSAPHKFEPEKFRLDSGQSEAVTVAEFPQDVLKKVVAANRKVRDSRESARKKRIE